MPLYAYAVTYITYSVSGRRFLSVSLDVVTTRCTSRWSGNVGKKWTEYATIGVALLCVASCHVTRTDELLSTVAFTLTTASSVISMHHPRTHTQTHTQTNSVNIIIIIIMNATVPYLHQ